ncbi:histone-lysine N-methyltransferase SETMAR-like isoform 1-T1 [Hipposideros larvatus]
MEILETVDQRNSLCCIERESGPCTSGKNVCQACEKLHKVYGDNALQECQYQRWFMKFRAGEFDLNDAPRSERPTKVDDDKIKALI